MSGFFSFYRLVDRRLTACPELVEGQAVGFWERTLTNYLAQEAKMDARWDAVRKANLHNDHGGPRPTEEEYELIRSLAYELWRTLGINFTELGEILCLFTDIDVSRSRVWNWVDKGTRNNPAARPHSFPVKLS